MDDRLVMLMEIKNHKRQRGCVCCVASTTVRPRYTILLVERRPIRPSQRGRGLTTRQRGLNLDNILAKDIVRCARGADTSLIPSMKRKLEPDGGVVVLVCWQSWLVWRQSKVECEVVLSLLLWFWFYKRKDPKMPTAIESTTATRTHQKNATII